VTKILRHTTTWSILLCALVCPELRAYQATGPAGLDPDSERLMQVILSDGTVMSNAVVIYPTTSNDWLVPLGEISESLGFAVRASASLGVAEGFIIKEQRPFRLDTHACRVQYESRSEAYDCRDAVSHQEDIFVERRLYQTWFPVTIKVNPLRSQIVIYPREKLPLQLRREREQQAERSRGLKEDFDPGFPRLATPHDWLEAPFIDEQLNFADANASGKHDTQLQHNTQVSGELLGLEAYMFLTGDQRKFSTKRFNFARRWTGEESPNGGPLKVREVQLWISSCRSFRSSPT
jgi:hypothetical protein